MNNRFSSLTSTPLSSQAFSQALSASIFSSTFPNPHTLHLFKYLTAFIFNASCIFLAVVSSAGEAVVSSNSRREGMSLRMWVREMEASKSISSVRREVAWGRRVWREEWRR